MREHIATVGCWDFNLETPAFSHSTVLWKENDIIYIGTYPHRKFDISELDTLTGDAVIPEEVYGAWHDGLTEVPDPPPSDAYMKKPALVSYTRGSSSIAEGVLAEAEILETLKKYPHPNIAVYYGCVREGDLITALCYKRYEYTISEAVRDDLIPVDRRAAILEGIAAGLQHLHSLGLVHNDINANNIMFDEQLNPVIIDFDSCRKEGEEFPGATIGWEDDHDISTKDIDLAALKLVEKFITGEFSGMPA